jgi:anthranilate synthase component 1
MELVAATREGLADLETPVSAFLKLCRGRRPAYLFESGETVGPAGRWSVVAWRPVWRLRLWPRSCELEHAGRRQRHGWRRFFALARRVEEEVRCAELPALPFVGALVGYLGYDLARLVEERLGPIPEQEGPVAELCYPTRFVVFDHLRRLLTLVALDTDQEAAQRALEEMVARLETPLVFRATRAELRVTPPPRGRFQEAVMRAKEYIAAGDIFQVVLADRFQVRGEVDPVSAYRWLRVHSPSPYMFLLQLEGMTLVGSSPETLVKLEQGRVYLRPIAGTRARGSDPERDQALEQELLASDKERAEHLMLVDLARNDAGRVCRAGSVVVDPYLTVERYSHVMHLVSQVSGRLLPGLDAWQVLGAAFPAGTVSGAPKVRAMQIIDELEAAPRGVYAGAVGRFGPGAELDTCIAIRLIRFTPQGIDLPVGAGVVADSVPEREYAEIEHKAAQGLAALAAAGEGRP